MACDTPIIASRLTGITSGGGGIHGVAMAGSIAGGEVGMPLSGTEQVQHPDVSSYIEIRGGLEYCTLCWKYGSEEHYRSYKHQNKVWWWENRLQSQSATHLARPAPSVLTAESPESAAVYDAMLTFENPPPGQPSWYTWQPETLSWYCNLCWKTANENHIYSEKHKRMAQWEEKQAQTGTSCVSAPPGNPSWYKWEAWTETWFCALCWKTADESHVVSKKHLNKAYWQEKKELTGQTPLPGMLSLHTVQPLPQKEHSSPPPSQQQATSVLTEQQSPLPLSLSANACGQQSSPPQVPSLQFAQLPPPQKHSPPPPSQQRTKTVSSKQPPPPPPPLAPPPPPPLQQTITVSGDHSSPPPSSTTTILGDQPSPPLPSRQQQPTRSLPQSSCIWERVPLNDAPGIYVFRNADTQEIRSSLPRGVMKFFELF